MSFTFARIAPHWARLSWPVYTAFSTETRLALEALLEVPGVKRFASALELPSTVRWLPQTERLARACEIDLDGSGWPIDGLSYLLPETCASGALYDYQIFAGTSLVRTRVGLLADQMGLGKTRAAAAAALRVHREYGRPVAIVGPLSSRAVWRRELAAIGAVVDSSQFCELSSRDIADESFNPKAQWFFVHYDIARSWWSKLYPLRPCCGIADEAHYVKNSRSARSIGTNMILGSCPYRFLLTGTPVENKPADLWNLLTIMTGPQTWGGPIEFRRRYCGAQYNGFGYTDDEPTYVEELKQRLSTFYTRRTVETAGLKLPAFTRTLELCESLSHEVRRSKGLLSEQRISEIVRAVVSGAMHEGLLALLTDLRQSASRAKLDTTVEYVQNALEQGESVVVFTWEREIARMIAFALKTDFLVTGDTAPTLREQLVERFQFTSGPTAFVATYGALREGVTLHRARIVVLHDLLVVLTQMLQAEARVYRVGQARAVQAVWMVAENTVDTLIAPILEEKARALGQLVDSSASEEWLNLQLARNVGVEDVDTQVARALETWSQSHG